MGGGRIKYLVLLLVYAFYFASTSFFYHSHQLAGSKIVHSHPWSGRSHTHTPGQILTIDLIASEVYEEAESAVTPDPAVELVLEDAAIPVGDSCITSPVQAHCLRAPPVTFC